MIEMLSVTVLLGLLMAMGFPRLREAVERAREVKAISDLKAMVAALSFDEKLPTSLAAIGWQGRLDPWKRPYVYYVFPATRGKAPPAGARKDRFLVPINSRFDLYSRGRDGASAQALTAATSRDDIVVANDGGFVGLARKY